MAHELVVNGRRGRMVYDRKVLIEVLIYHQRKNVTYCMCGWSELGRSHAEHIADVYEQSIKGRS
jgi:hypothetical protein